MKNLNDKLTEYTNKGFSEHSRKDRGGVSGYTIEIELRKDEETIFLLYDPTKNKCRERTQRDINENKMPEVIKYLNTKKKT